MPLKDLLKAIKNYQKISKGKYKAYKEIIETLNDKSKNYQI